MYSLWICYSWFVKVLSFDVSETCGPPPYVVRAFHDSEGISRFPLGSQVTYRCQDGFTLTERFAHTRALCDHGERWEGPRMSCKRKVPRMLSFQQYLLDTNFRCSVLKNEHLLKFEKWKASLILHFSGNFKYQQNSKVYKIFENWCSRILMTPQFIKLCIKLKCLDLAVVLHAIALVQNILLYTYCTWYIKVMFGVNDAYVKLRFHYHD